MLQEPRYLFIGDSITDSDRRTTHPPYGRGFVDMVRVMLQARYAERKPIFINRGVNGNNVLDLAARWQTDVIAHNPGILTILIGINDVARQFDPVPTGAVYPDDFRRTLRDLVTMTQARNKVFEIYLMTPYLIHYDTTLPIRQQMDRYGQIVREIAAEKGTKFVDLQAAFDEALRVTVPEWWATDYIHPQGPGHALIARAWMKAYGFEL